MTIIAGTYSLPLTLTTSAASFKSNLWCTASSTGFAFNPQLVANSGSLSGSSYLGVAGSQAAGTYSVVFWCNDTNYQSPAAISVKVVDGQVTIPPPSALSVKFTKGFLTQTSYISIDLSDYPPWQDITITPTPNNGNITVWPPSVVITAGAKVGQFAYQIQPSASASFTTKVSFKVTGTNGASYTMPGTQTVTGTGSRAV